MNSNDLENLEENIIFLEIGKSLHQTSGILGFDEKDYIKLGKQWFEDNKINVKKHICTKQLTQIIP